MDFYNIVLGLSLTILGILLVVYYQQSIKIKKQGLYFSRIKNAGFLLIMWGIVLIVRTCK
jgi:uncharacterized membrane protein